MQNFTDKDELFAYTSDPAYQKGADKGHDGVCFGFEMVESSVKEWKLRLYFSD